MWSIRHFSRRLNLILMCRQLEKNWSWISRIAYQVTLTRNSVFGGLLWLIFDARFFLFAHIRYLKRQFWARITTIRIEIIEIIWQFKSKKFESIYCYIKPWNFEYWHLYWFTYFIIPTSGNFTSCAYIHR